MAYTKTEWVTGETPLSADNLNNIENGIEAADLAVTPELWTSYSFNSYTATDTGFSWVYVIGKLCIFSLAFQYTADYTPTNTQVFVTGMPVPLHPMFCFGQQLHASTMEVFKCVVNSDGNITNWYSGVKTYRNQPAIVTGMYVIA